MDVESDELVILRREFAEFEDLLGRGDALGILKDAIYSYQDISCDDALGEREKKIANNILNAYAQKFISEAQKIKSDTRRFEHAFHEYWANMTSQFLEVETDCNQDARESLLHFLVNWSMSIPFKS
jgi:hypothetical protein